MSPVDFFLKVYDPEKGDKALQESISHYIQGRMGKILELLRTKQTFIMGKDGEPTWRKVSIAPERASVLFHFHRQQDGNTHYFPTIKYAGDKMEFMFKNAALICYEPAWLMLNGVIYSFEKPIDGKKLLPFLNKRQIIIPRTIEDNYFSKFVAPLLESFDVFATAFEIRKEKYNPAPQLVFSTIKAANVPGLLARTQPDSKADREPDKILFELSYKYGDQEVQAAENKKISVSLEKTADKYVFHRLVRDAVREKELCKELNTRGLELKNGKTVLEKGAAFAWLGAHITELEEKGYTIKQSDLGGKKLLYWRYSRGGRYNREKRLV